MGDNLLPNQQHNALLLNPNCQKSESIKIEKKINKICHRRKFQHSYISLRGATSIRLRSNRSPVGVIPCVTLYDRITEIYTELLHAMPVFFCACWFPCLVFLNGTFQIMLRHFYASSITVQLALELVLTQLLSLEEKSFKVLKQRCQGTTQELTSEIERDFFGWKGIC